MVASCCSAAARLICSADGACLLQDVAVRDLVARVRSGWKRRVLIGARLAQGVGAAMMTPAALSILTTSFHTRGDRVKALGAWGGAAAVSGAAGVLFGGVLTSEVSLAMGFSSSTSPS